MSRPTKIFFLIFLFIALRLALFNLNAAEWGDSYHILRSSQEVTQLKYSLEEKRLPAFSALMAPFLFVFEPVVAGRVVIALATLIVLILSYKLSQELFPKSNWHLWVPVLLCISPVFLYWSLRVMAIVPFTVLVLLSFCVFYLRKDPSFPKGRVFPFLGAVLGFTCLTRYEGFLLLPGFFLFFVLKRRWRELVTVFIPWVLITLPWFVWSKLIAKGPAGAAYLEEAATFSLLDWGRVRFWSLSVLFLFIFPPFAVFVFRGLRRAIGGIGEMGERGGNLIDYLPLGLFLVLELALAFFWTPSVPRILVPVMPFLLMLFLEGVGGPNSPELDSKGLGSEGVLEPSPWGFRAKLLSFGPLRIVMFILSLLLFLLYILGQYTDRLYFLVLSRGGIMLVLGFSGLTLLSLIRERWYRRYSRLRGVSYVFFLLVLAVASFVIVGNQRRVYESVRKVSEMAAQLDGRTAYFDETGVSWWYLSWLSGKGVYLPQKAKFSSEKQWQWLGENNVKYVLWTNEFNRGSVLNILSDPRYEDRFELVFREEVKVVDVIDGWLIKLRVLPERKYPVLRSALYLVRHK